MKYFASVILILFIGVCLQPFSAGVNQSCQKSGSKLDNSESHLSTVYSTQSHAPIFWAVEIEDSEEEEKSIFARAQASLASNSLLAIVCACIMGCIAALLKVRLNRFKPETHRHYKVPLFVEVCNYRI